MHEVTLFKHLLEKVEELARENNATQVTKIKIRLGALSNISPGHFREHFDEVKPDSMAKFAELEIKQMSDETDPDAQEIILESIEVE